MRIVHHNKGYRALLTDRKVQADLEARAQRIAAATGDESIVAVSSAPAHTRARAAVFARRGDPENKIIRALDAGRA